jgi:hypothetical protein
MPKHKLWLLNQMVTSMPALIGSDGAALANEAMQAMEDLDEDNNE